MGTINVKLDDEEHIKLKHKCVDLGKSQSEFIRELVSGKSYIIPLSFVKWCEESGHDPVVTLNEWCFDAIKSY